MLDRWLINSLDCSLIALAQKNLSGLILQSASDRVFVAGADLAEIDALNDADLDVYLRAGSVAYGRITKLPFTSVAIIHKAALGGGLELAMHCDALIGATPAPGEKSWKVGLPECGLGICPGWGGTMMLAARMDISKAILATCAGAPFDATEIPTGLFAKNISPLSIADPQFHQATFAALAQLETQLPNTAAARAVIDAIKAGLQHGFQAGVLCEQKHLIDLRHTPEARARLDAFLKR